MSSELEIEFKNLVTKDEMLRMMSEFNVQPNDMLEQKNYYFDTSQFDIKNINCALRIRQKNRNYELTLKQPVEVGNLETNQEIDESDAVKMIETGYLPNGEVKKALEKLNIQYENLLSFGNLTTKRAEIVYLEGLLVFDNSFYLNKEDFEIEYEVKDRNNGEQNFLALMERFQIPIRATENKIIRFYREYKNLER